MSNTCTYCSKEFSEADRLTAIWDGYGAAHFDCYYDRATFSNKLYLPKFAIDRLKQLGDDRIKFFISL